MKTESYTQRDTTYLASPTLADFHLDRHFVRGIRGPIGSGKSVGMCWEIMWKACTQESFEGVRYSRWVIIRNSYRELTDTTLKTWFDWFPENLGNWVKGEMKHHIRMPLPDGTILDLEVLFRALDKPKDVKKLLSLELTGGWINEAKEIPKSVLDMLQGRVGRYPPKKLGGASWFGVIMDTNSPDSDHWWYNMFEEELPTNWSGFHQPSGMDPLAENKENLPQDYYENLVPGKTQEWINVFVHGQYGFVSDGLPIYPEFNFDIHVADEDIEANPKFDLWVGIDFGRTPAAAFAQEVYGQWRFIDEITTDNMGAVEFAQVLGKHIRQNYRNYNIHIFGDPAGDDKTQVDDRTPFLVLQEAHIDVEPAPSQDPVIRREAVAGTMTRLTNLGNPGVIASPVCRRLIRGWAGGFKYKRIQVSGEERFHNVPDKNRYSHVCEAAEYLLVGAGEDCTDVGGTVDNQLDYTNLNNAA